MILLDNWLLQENWEIYKIKKSSSGTQGNSLLLLVNEAFALMTLRRCVGADGNLDEKTQEIVWANAFHCIMSIRNDLAQNENTFAEWVMHLKYHNIDYISEIKKTYESAKTKICGGDYEDVFDLIKETNEFKSWTQKFTYQLTLLENWKHPLSEFDPDLNNYARASIVVALVSNRLPLGSNETLQERMVMRRDALRGLYAFRNDIQTIYSLDYFTLENYCIDILSNMDRAYLSTTADLALVYDKHM